MGRQGSATTKQSLKVFLITLLYFYEKEYVFPYLYFVIMQRVLQISVRCKVNIPPTVVCVEYDNCPLNFTEFSCCSPLNSAKFRKTVYI